MNDGQIPNSRGVRVDVGTGYNPAEGNRRASRNGRVSDLPPETPSVTIRNFCIAELPPETPHVTIDSQLVHRCLAHDVCARCTCSSTVLTAQLTSPPALLLQYLEEHDEYAAAVTRRLQRMAHYQSQHCAAGSNPRAGPGELRACDVAVCLADVDPAKNQVSTSFPVPPL